MGKIKGKSNLIQHVKRLPQAGIIYAIRSQDIVAIRNYKATNEHNSKLYEKMNSNNNKAITTQSEDSWNTTGTLSELENFSNEDVKGTRSNSTVSISTENIMEHLFTSNDKTDKKFNTLNSKYSMFVNRGSLDSTSTSRKTSNIYTKSTSDTDNNETKIAKPQNYIKKIKKSYKNSPRLKSKLKHKREISRRKSARSRSPEINTSKGTNIEIKTTNKTDNQICSPILDTHISTSKRVSKIKNHDCESDISSDCLMQRDNSEFLSRFQDISVEMSRLKVKYNELSLENNSLKQMTDNLSMEINNLRHENSNVKTRNETLAARNLENQNLSRIVDCLNKKINELCKEIEQSQCDQSDKTRKIVELEKNINDIKEKSALNLIEMEHLKDQLCQKEEVISKLSQNRKIDESKDLQMKLIYNELVELKGNIRVICRVKPESNNLIQIIDNESLQIPSNKNRGRCPVFNFNRVLRPTCAQTDVFNEVKPLITSFVDGYNVSMITYGQSGSGKTHTMLGGQEDPGIVTHSIREVFKLCSLRTGWNYKVCLSILEIYNEIIFDLLASTNNHSLNITSNHTNPQIIRTFWRKRTQIHDDGKCIHIKGLSEIEIHHEEELLQYINRSSKNRSTAITVQNSDSSRSHFIVMLRIYGKNHFQNSTTQGVLMLCDLAGSENCSSSLMENSLIESKYISRSLTVLGRVFEALYNRITVIPFRDSKLTHIMKPSLSGEAKFAFIVTVSGKLENLNNTLRVLQLAKKISQISLGQPRKNNFVNVRNPNSLCRS